MLASQLAPWIFAATPLDQAVWGSTEAFRGWFASTAAEDVAYSPNQQSHLTDCAVDPTQTHNAPAWVRHLGKRDETSHCPPPKAAKGGAVKDTALNSGRADLNL
jgi:hypothetical protein